MPPSAQNSPRSSLRWPRSALRSGPTSPPPPRSSAAYEETGGAPILLRDGDWDDNVELAMSTLASAPDHAMRGEYPNRATFIDARNELPKLVDALDAVPDSRLEPAERAALVAALDQADFDPDAPNAVELLAERLSSPDPAVNPVPRLAELYAARENAVGAWQTLASETEVALAEAIAEFGSEMRLAYRDNTPRTKVARLFGKARAGKKTIERARVLAYLRHARTHGFEPAFTKVLPPHDGYLKLVDARRRYAEIAANGGWGTIKIPKLGKLRHGREYAGIADMKTRLEAEGFDPGPIDDQLNDELVAAIRDYQSTRQLKEDGEIDRKLINNLNLSVENRLAKIDITLQRYRWSNLGTFRYYVFVNIPDFHTEAWRDGERQMRFRIVVGKNDIKRDAAGNIVRDRDGDAIFPNRTPLQTAFMERVIYNPFWNIPPRIFEEEYAAKIEENPFWPEENGYEIVNPDTNRSYMRMLPGDDNALGRVKFIFPNPHDTYLHDTPSKRLFRNPVRAYSHGCMRVQDPLDFAQFLLEQDGQWDERRVRDILGQDEPRETTINLRHDVPVHVDYLNTRVDDDGRVHFLSDVYRYDKKKVERRERVLSEQFASN